MAECEHVEAGFIDVSQVLRGGVYLLAHQGVVVYVGKAQVMLGRIYSHRVKWGTKSRKPITAAIPAKGMLFDQVFVRPCSSAEIDELEARLVDQYRPRYNTQLKFCVPPELTDLVARIVARGGAVVAPPSRINRRGF